MAIRVLLIDDQVLTRQGLRMVLQDEKDIEIVGDAKTGRDAVEKAIALSPEIVLIDIPMHGGDGIESARTIMERCPNTQILFLMAYIDAELFQRASAAGAVGYVLKNITPANLATAIRAVHNRVTMIIPPILRQIFDVLIGKSNISTEKVLCRLHGLTGREGEVLIGIAHGLSDKEIASNLLVSESTVKTHLRAIYRRLKLRNRAQAAAFAVKHDFLPRSK